MSELVEKVAQALFDIEHERIGSRWEDEDASGKAYWHQSAHAAITVILQEIAEPSEGMMSAGFDVDSTNFKGLTPVDDIWRAMLAQWAEDHGVKL